MTECWVGIGLPFRPCVGTYTVYNTNLLPPIETVKYQSIITLLDIIDTSELFNFNSVTGCYIDVDVTTGQFYRDQQDCIIWKLINGQVVAYNDEDEKIGIVANNLAEFFSRIEIENKIWYLTYRLDKSGGGWSKAENPNLKWTQLQELLDDSCLAYLILYYFRYLGI